MPDEPEPPAPPAALERGRFAVFGDGTPMSIVIARATGLCDRCSSCGCGTQQPPISVAALVKDMMRSPVQAIRAARAFMGDHAEEGLEELDGTETP